jgi:hypothetical protein
LTPRQRATPVPQLNAQAKKTFPVSVILAGFAPHFREFAAIHAKDADRISIYNEPTPDH